MASPNKPVAPIDQARLTPELAEPYIQAGLITQQEIDIFARGFQKTMTYSTVGFIAGSLAPLPLTLMKVKTTFLQRLFIGTAGCIGGGISGTSIGALRMQSDLRASGTQDINKRLAVYQGLILHQTDPIRNPAPPLNPNAPPGNSRQPPTLGSKPFPMPKYDAGVDSQGRSFPQKPSDSFVADGDDNADLGDFNREREREKALGMLGGGRLGTTDSAEYGSLDRATKENPTSWALLRSRATPGTSSSLPTPLSTSSSPVSSDFSTSSLPPPSIPSSSLDTFASSDSAQSDNRPMTDREREQAEFDKIVERERHAVDAGFGSGGNSWGQIRDDGKKEDKMW